MKPHLVVTEETIVAMQLRFLTYGVIVGTLIGVLVLMYRCSCQ